MALEWSARSFDGLAGEVIDRARALLGTDISIADEHGVVVASSQPQAVGLRLAADGDSAARPPLRVPVQLDARRAEVVVAASTTESGHPRLTQAVIDLIVTQAAVLARLPNRDELKNTFILDLLRGTATDETDVPRRADILGMDIARPRAAMLIDASDYILRAPGSDHEMASQRRAQHIIASIVEFFTLPNDTICAYIGNGEVVVLKASTTQDLVAWSDTTADDGRIGASWANLSALKRASQAMLARLRRDTGTGVTIGIGRYHPGWRGLARSYRDADLALALGRRFHGANAVHCLDSIGVVAFAGVSDEETRIELASHLLAPLDGEGELLRTMHVFFAKNCCPSAAAKRLRIHRNTLSYRLEKIALLTGLDPRRFDDAVQLRMATLLCEGGDGGLNMEEGTGTCMSLASTPRSTTRLPASSRTAA